MWYRHRKKIHLANNRRTKGSGVMVSEGENAMPSAVVYHYPCPDGVFAALAAHLYHSIVGKMAFFYPNSTYHPLRADQLFTGGIDVCYLLDYVGPDGFAMELCQRAKRVVVLDHHKTALEKLPSNEEGPKNFSAIIDMNRSGATIAYDYFKNKLQEKDMTNSSLVPKQDLVRVERLYKYIEDGDLWRWALPDSKAFASGLGDLQIEYSTSVNFSLFDQLLALDPDAIIAKGKASMTKKQVVIDEALEKSFEVKLGAGKFGRCLAVRADDIYNLRSELGNQLASKSRAAGLRPMGAVVYEVKEVEDNGQVKVSLRSLDGDTTEISKVYGGGGHHAASSFMISKNEFESWK